MTEYLMSFFLFPLNRLVRESIPDAALGLFVHTPFPSSEVFRCLPRESQSYEQSVPLDICPFLSIGRKEILDGMLGANLVCFQVSCSLLLAWFEITCLSLHACCVYLFPRPTPTRDILSRRASESAATRQHPGVSMLKDV